MDQITLFQIFRDFIGTVVYILGFAHMYGVSKSSRLAAIGCALLSWFSYKFMQSFGMGIIPAAFIATILLTLYAEIMARVLKRPVPSFLLLGLLPLVPGGSIYHAMLHLVNNRQGEAMERAFEAFGLAAAMAAGIVFVTAFFKVKPSPRMRTLWRKDQTSSDGGIERF